MHIDLQNIYIMKNQQFNEIKFQLDIFWDTNDIRSDSKKVLDNTGYFSDMHP